MRYRRVLFALAVFTALGITVIGALVARTGSPPTGRWMVALPMVNQPAPSATTVPAPQKSPGCDGDPHWDCDQQRRFTAAAALLAQQPGKLSVVVSDRTNGAVWRAGDTSSTTWTASTIKVAIVTALLERHHQGIVTLTATDRENMHEALHSSSNDAATALWDRYGGQAMFDRFRTQYQMTSLSVVPGYELFWRNLRCSADDLFHLMSYTLTSLQIDDRTYLVQELREVADNQHWGVWAAGAGLQPGNKDGWAQKPDNGGTHWVTHTMGFAGPAERYVVVVTYNLPPAGTLSTGVHTVSNLVATIFGAPVPASVSLP
jgi:hypothetical protein